jgi:tetratricopeptide (TPR) repeat protein
MKVKSSASQAFSSTLLFVVVFGCMTPQRQKTVVPPPPAKKSADRLTVENVFAKLSELGSTTVRLHLGLSDADMRSFSAKLWPPTVRESPSSPIVRTSNKGDRVAIFQHCNDAAQHELAEGEALFRLHNIVGAAEKYSAARKIDPKCQQAWTFLGDCAFQAGLYEQAIKQYDEAIRLNGNDFLPVFFRANALARLKRNTEAVGEILRFRMFSPVSSAIGGRCARD